MKLDEQTLKPKLNPETLESNVPGIYLAGVVIGGRHTSEIFIENGRFHGKLIIDERLGREGASGCGNCAIVAGLQALPGRAGRLLQLEHGIRPPGSS